MDVLILYEHKIREINNACLIKNELELRGYKVKIASLYNITTPYLIQPIFFSKPKLVIVPWLYGTVEVNKIRNLFKDAEFKLVNLQCEQIISEKWIESGYFFPKGEARKYLHVCWGENIEKRLITLGLHKKNLLTIGALSTDYDKNNFRKLFVDKSFIANEYKLRKESKWSLFISSFTYTTLTEEEISELYQRTSAKKDDFAELMRRSKKTIVSWMIKFLIENKNIEFIYRPHPGEREDSYLKKLEKEYENFHVISERSVSQWIYVCDNINSWFSTSTVDAYFLDKEFAIIRPYSIPKYLDSEILTDLSYIDKYETFRAFNKGDIKIENKMFSEKVRKFYEYSNEEYVYLKLCNKIEELLCSDLDDFKLSTKHNGKVKYLQSVICYMTHYVKLSKILPYKKDILADFEKENYNLNMIIKKQCRLLRSKVYEN